jgi:hypothetical protein
MSDDLKTRLAGLAFLAGGALFGWMFIWSPYQDALSGEPEIHYSTKAFVIVPMCLVFGLVLATIGTRYAYRNPEKKQLTPLGWALFGVMILLTGGIWWWLETRFAALGYR